MRLVISHGVPQHFYIQEQDRTNIGSFENDSQAIYIYDFIYIYIYLFIYHKLDH